MYSTANIQNSIVLNPTQTYNTSVPKFKWNMPSSASTEPVTQGSSKNDSFVLDEHSRGFIFGNGGNDSINYSSLGRLNTLINGGAGEDTLGFQNLKVQDVLQKLLHEKYSFVTQDHGFSLRTQDGQQIQIEDVEKVAFADKTFDLRNQTDLHALLNALKEKKINIIDETSTKQAKSSCGCPSNTSHVTPNSFSNYGSSLVPVGNHGLVSVNGQNYRLVPVETNTHSNFGGGYSFPANWGMPMNNRSWTTNNSYPGNWTSNGMTLSSNAYANSSNNSSASANSFVRVSVI
jgi:hypothetical protein